MNTNNFNSLSFREKIAPHNLFLWNDNFFLWKEDLINLLNKRSGIKWLYGWTYKELYMTNLNKFNNALYNAINHLFSSDEKYDALLLYANKERIWPYIIDWEKALSDKPEFFYEYNPYIPQDIAEIEEIMKDYILIDLETTWFTKLCQIIQVGIGFFWEANVWNEDYDKSKMLRKTEFFVAPYKDYINDEIFDITWIRQQDIEEKGHNIEKVLDFLYTILDGKVVAAHNAAFDYWKICEAFIDFRRKPPVPSKLIDTIDLFKLINLKKKFGLWQFNLNRMAKAFLWEDIENLDERHTALFDVKVTHEALKAATTATELANKKKKWK